MTEDTEPDPQRKWLRLIDPLVTASLPIRIDPRLELDDDTASRLRGDAEPLLTMVTVFVTSSYDNVLAAEITDDVEHGLHVLVRAATGDEATYLLCPADEEDGGHPETAGRDITWQQVQDSEDFTEPAVVLWSGEAPAAQSLLDGTSPCRCRLPDHPSRSEAGRPQGAVVIGSTPRGEAAKCRRIIAIDRL